MLKGILGSFSITIELAIVLGITSLLSLLVLMLIILQVQHLSYCTTNDCGF